MKCPHCQAGSESRVIDSRPARNRIRRRRQCQKCGERFTTVEHVLQDPDFDSMLGVTASLEAAQRQVTDAMVKVRAIQAEVGR